MSVATPAREPPAGAQGRYIVLDRQVLKAQERLEGSGSRPLHRQDFPARVLDSLESCQDKIRPSLKAQLEESRSRLEAETARADMEKLRADRLQEEMQRREQAARREMQLAGDRFAAKFQENVNARKELESWEAEVKKARAQIEAAAEDIREKRARFHEEVSQQQGELEKRLARAESLEAAMKPREDRCKAEEERILVEKAKLAGSEAALRASQKEAAAAKEKAAADQKQCAEQRARLTAQREELEVAQAKLAVEKQELLTERQKNVEGLKELKEARKQHAESSARELDDVKKARKEQAEAYTREREELDRVRRRQSEVLAREKEELEAARRSAAKEKEEIQSCAEKEKREIEAARTALSAEERLASERQGAEAQSHAAAIAEMARQKQQLQTELAQIAAETEAAATAAAEKAVETEVVAVAAAATPSSSSTENPFKQLMAGFAAARPQLSFPAADEHLVEDAKRSRDSSVFKDQLRALEAALAVRKPEDEASLGSAAEGIVGSLLALQGLQEAGEKKLVLEHLEHLGFRVSKLMSLSSGLAARGKEKAGASSQRHETPLTFALATASACCLLWSSSRRRMQNSVSSIRKEVQELRQALPALETDLDKLQQKLRTHFDTFHPAITSVAGSEQCSREQAALTEGIEDLKRRVKPFLRSDSVGKIIDISTKCHSAWEILEKYLIWQRRYIQLRRHGTPGPNDFRTLLLTSLLDPEEDGSAPKRELASAIRNAVAQRSAGRKLEAGKSEAPSKRPRHTAPATPLSTPR